MAGALADGWCVITGGTSGIGRAVALELAKYDRSIVILGRDPAKASETLTQLSHAGARRAEALVGDLSSLEEVRRLARELRAKFNPMAALVNNVGALFLRRQQSADGLEMTWALNHLSYFLLTQQLIDLIIKTDGARIVNVASEAHQKGQIQFPNPCRLSGAAAYSQSKLANVMFTRSLARRLNGTGVTANAIHPGRVASGFGTNNGWMWRVARPFVHRNAITPPESAPAIARLLLEPTIGAISGCYFDQLRKADPSPQTLDDELCDRLWALSSQMTNEPASFR